MRYKYTAGGFRFLYKYWTNCPWPEYFPSSSNKSTQIYNLFLCKISRDYFGYSNKAHYSISDTIRITKNIYYYYSVIKKVAKNLRRKLCCKTLYVSILSIYLYTYLFSVSINLKPKSNQIIKSDKDKCTASFLNPRCTFYKSRKEENCETLDNNWTNAKWCYMKRSKEKGISI